MSLIGPRPFILDDLKLFRKNSPAHYALRSTVKSKAGLTGLWQILGDRSASYENLIYWDKYYSKNVDFHLDIKIAYYTVKILLQCKHSDSILGGHNKIEEKKIIGTASGCPILNNYKLIS